MPTKKRIPPEDVIREESEPAITEVDDDVEVDIDDAQIQESRDDAFRKAPQTAQPPKQRRKKA
jgi:hypothetical protein